VNLTGGTHADVDWRRDVHKLVLALPPLPGQPVNNRALAPQVIESFVTFADTGFRGAPIDPAAMRERQRAERSYVLLFDTNGVFHADNIPPGKYQLAINVTDPEDENYNRRSIGFVASDITVPDDKAAAVNAPLDIGAVDLTITPRLRVGRLVPSFAGKTSDGKTNQLSEFRGKPVLLYFWAMSMGYSSFDFQVLKELQQNFGASGQLVVLSCNLDPPGNNAEQFAQRQGFNWKQLYLGPWDQSPVPALFGFNNTSGGVLIDAGGKLASGPMRGSAMRNTVTGAVAEQ
jgi:thiol-disulfide isomerase/thioredoxin